MAMLDESGNRRVIRAFAVAGLVRPVIVFAVGAEEFADVDYVFGVAGFFGLRWRSALVMKRLLDRPGILQAAGWATENAGGVGGYWGIIRRHGRLCQCQNIEAAPLLL